MPVNIESWGGNKALSFGSIYFGALTFIESRRYFSKMTALTFHLVNGTLVRTPKSKIRYVSGQIKGHVLSKNNVQRGFLLLFTGSAVTAISLVTLSATFNVESWFGKAALWVFFVPFLIFGVSSVFSAVAFRLIAWRKGPSLLSLQQQALRDDNKLYVVGNIPKYLEREKRTGFSVQLIHYRVDSIAGEEIVVSVKELLNEKMTDKHLTYQTTDRGTKFRLEYLLPSSSKLTEDSSGFHVWHLQANMDETVETEGAKRRNYSWVVAFPLPLDLHRNAPQ